LLTGSGELPRDCKIDFGKEYYVENTKIKLELKFDVVVRKKPPEDWTPELRVYDNKPEKYTRMSK
jgi:hypothetical protein